jgi:hypothetical protein
MRITSQDFQVFLVGAPAEGQAGMVFEQQRDIEGRCFHELVELLLQGVRLGVVSPAEPDSVQRSIGRTRLCAFGK